MRIIAGMYRGLPLVTLKGKNLRPTSEHLRETLFDVLGPRIARATFLDCYAGSGAVGLEALSRGAAEVVFIEHHRPAAELIRRNLATLGRESGFRLLTCRVASGLEQLAAETARFDYVFLDPPYNELREYHHVLRQLARLNLLFPASQVMVEHSRHCLLEARYGQLERTRLIRHGDAQLSFYQIAKQTHS